MNDKKLWFRAKNYGWGWYPSSWQGWLVLAIFIVYVSWAAFDLDAHQHSVSDLLINLLPRVGLAVIVLLLICWKTGEKPEWRWGKPKDHDKK